MAETLEEAKSPEKFLETFFRELDARIKGVQEIRAVYDEHIAFDFNVMQFISIDENKISDILKFFLDPEESHGQKDTFLRTFWNHFDLPELFGSYPITSDTEVKREDNTGENKRIDITIRIDKHLWIGIENKIYDWTPDQDQQVKHYGDDLGGRGGNYVLFYITPNGKAPAKHSIDTDECEKRQIAGKLKCISYRHDIIPLLEKFESACRADNARWFIRQFQQYLRQTYLGEKSMSEQSHIKQFVEDNPQILKDIDAVKSAADSFRNEFYENFWEQVKQYIEPLRITSVEWDPSWLWVSFDFPGSKMESDKLQLRGAYDPKNKNVPLSLFIGNFVGPHENKVGVFENKMRVQFPDMRSGRDLRGGCKHWKAVFKVPTNPLSDEAIIKIVSDQTGTSLSSAAKEAASVISTYFNTAEDIWKTL